jgi:two-component system, LytTR family, response regulator
MQTSIQQKETNCILVPTDRGMQVIDVHSIIRVQSLSNYSKLFFQNGRTLVVAKVLRWFEERLLTYHFLRIHRAHLVNSDRMKAFKNANTIEIELMNGERLIVARRKKNEFLAKVNNYNFPSSSCALP